MRIAAFERLFLACEIARFDKEQKQTYEKDMITERDYYNIINTAKDDGIKAGLEQGIARGRDEGIKEEKARVAKSLKALGVPVDTIMQATGLDKEEIERP